MSFLSEPAAFFWLPHCLGPVVADRAQLLATNRSLRAPTTSLATPTTSPQTPTGLLRPASNYSASVVTAVP